MTIDGFRKLLPSLDHEEIEFFAEETGETDENLLLERLLLLKGDVCKICPKTSDAQGRFAKLKMKHLSAYEYVLGWGERPGSILLDVGCGLGIDVRKIAADGFPAEKIIATDITRDLWNIGNRFFRTRLDRRPIHFIQGDILDLRPREPCYNLPAISPPVLSSQKDLELLHNQVTCIHASNMFHLLSETRQRDLATRLGGLLCGMGGCVIFGQQPGMAEPGEKTEDDGRRTYYHSPTSWKELWDGGVFDRGSVQCSAHLINTNDVEHIAEKEAGRGKEKVERELTLVWWVMRR